MALLEIRLLEDAELPFARHEALAASGNALSERHGDVDDVVFPCGNTTDPDGDTINVYYGAADCSIALARTSVCSLLEWLDANGNFERRQRVEDL
jgi:predicted GH43/DUF377 family glycosyl hydrolase